MSLLSLLANKDVKKKFAATFLKPRFKVNRRILARPLTKHYRLVGTAFDYVMRFYIKRINPKAVTSQWVSETALRLLRTIVNRPNKLDDFVFLMKPGLSMVRFSDQIIEDILRGLVMLKSSRRKLTDEQSKVLFFRIRFNLMGAPFYPFLFRYHRLSTFIKKCYLREANDIMSYCKRVYKRYTEKKKITQKNLASCALKLAQLDIIYRPGRYRPDLGIVDENDIKDLVHLFPILKKQKRVFVSKNICILNPTFGHASDFVGGADCDLIIDNTLIDIKTTKHLALTRKDFNQLIGYYILSRIGRIKGLPPRHPITTLGIYFSRYGVLYTIPVPTVINEPKLPSFIKWFRKRARREEKMLAKKFFSVPES